jgi:antibiotic biosynthesis monooxygenase (ABM) superfamily enzyme
LVVTALRESWLPGLPLLASVVVVSVANVCALTWFVMPKLNKWLSTWLSPAGAKKSSALASARSSGTHPTLR